MKFYNIYLLLFNEKVNELKIYLILVYNGFNIFIYQKLKNIFKSILYFFTLLSTINY